MTRLGQVEDTLCKSQSQGKDDGKWGESKVQFVRQGCKYRVLEEKKVQKVIKTQNLSCHE